MDPSNPAVNLAALLASLSDPSNPTLNPHPSYESYGYPPAQQYGYPQATAATVHQIPYQPVSEPLGHHLSEQPNNNARQPQKPYVDPSRVLDWPTALKMAVKLLNENDEVIARIRKLITVQKQHERQWWAGREALLQNQKERIANRKKLDEMLKSVGGLTSEDQASAIDPEKDRLELKRYDMKVLSRSNEMFKSFAQEFKEVGIPFFGVPEELITPSSGQKRPIEHTSSPRSSSSVTREQLMALQRKMIAFLEDMAGGAPTDS